MIEDLDLVDETAVEGTPPHDQEPRQYRRRRAQHVERLERLSAMDPERLAAGAVDEQLCSAQDPPIGDEPTERRAFIDITHDIREAERRSDDQHHHVVRVPEGCRFVWWSPRRSHGATAATRFAPTRCGTMLRYSSR